MTDLETRLRAEMQARAAGPTPVLPTGTELRAAARRAQAGRTKTGIAAALIVFSTMLSGALLVAPSSPRPGQPAPRNAAHPLVVPSALPLGTPRHDSVAAVRRDVVGVDDSWTTVLTRLLHGADLVLMRSDGGRRQRVLAALVRDGRVTGEYAQAWFGPLASDVVALPVSDGSSSSLVVLAPRRLGADLATVTVSSSTGVISRTSRPVSDGFVILPIPSTVTFTRLTLWRAGNEVHDGIPADALLPDSVPRDLERIVAGPTRGTQTVQVRTNGRIACRLTVTGTWQPNHVAVENNPFDDACAPVDSSFHLLLAKDRAYSSVAGIAPPGTRTVRLHWQKGSPTVLSVSTGDVPAFVDTLSNRDGGHAASGLVSAEALDAAGHVLAALRPARS